MPVSAYALASANQNEFSFAKELGFTLGGSLAFGPHFSLSEEGAMEHWRGDLHTYLALAGPRFACSAGRLTPFGMLMAGLGHAGPGKPAALPIPPHTHPTYYGPAVSLAAGLDLRLTDRLSWRVQANAARISTVPVYHPLTGSTGLVLRIFGHR